MSRKRELKIIRETELKLEVAYNEKNKKQKVSNRKMNLDNNFEQRLQ